MSVERTETIMQVDRDLSRLEDDLEVARIEDNRSDITRLLTEIANLRRLREQLMNDVL